MLGESRMSGRTVTHAGTHNQGGARQAWTETLACGTQSREDSSDHTTLHPRADRQEGREHQAPFIRPVHAPEGLGGYRIGRFQHMHTGEVHFMSPS